MRLIHTALFTLSALFSPLIVAAQEVGVTIPQPLGDVSVPRLVGNIIRNGLGLVGSIALIMFIYGGFLYMTAQGNEDQVQKGKKTLMFASLGLVIIFFAYAIVSFVITGLTAAPTEAPAPSGTHGPAGGQPLTQ